MSRSSISVVVPSFNHADYVERAIDSVLLHDGSDLEVIVVDDGSTDDSMTKLERYQHDPRVRIFAQENRGAHAALNRALELSQSEIIFVLNSDDTYAPGRIDTLAAHLDSNPDTALAATWIRIIDRDGSEIGVKRGWSNLPPWPPPTRGPYLSELGDPTLSLLESNYISTSSNMAFRRSLVTDSGLRFKPLRYAHDWEFALAAAAHGRIDLIEEPLLNYRVHPANTISEGADQSVGPMRFEIQWVVARYAYRILHQYGYGDREHEKLTTLLWNSMPSFLHQEILDQLLQIRGTKQEPPPHYDSLIEPDHPLYLSSSAVLALS